MEEVYRDIYHVKVPLMHSPLKELNCFMIRGGERNLIIDTGFNQPEAKAALTKAVEELGFDLSRTDLFITHLHSDHSGLACAFKNPRNRAYASETDARLINGLLTEEYWDEVDRRNPLIGFPPEDILDHRQHPAYAYRLDHRVDFTPAAEGDALTVGPYNFTVVEMAGHTPGQLGLYEKAHKICFCADHILAKITPNIITWDLEHDYLGIFLKNLQKVKEMDIRFLFGGHRAFVASHGERIDELFTHHGRRLGEVLKALETGPKSAYDTACLMSWEFGGGNFKDFPVQQKWFAASETFAHLQHLLFQGKASRSLRGGVFLYNLP